MEFKGIYRKALDVKQDAIASAESQQDLSLLTGCHRPDNITPGQDTL